MCHCNRRLLYQAPYLVCDVDDDGWRGDALAQEVDLFRWVQLVFFACKKNDAHKGASIYDVRSGWGGPQKATKMNKIS